MKTRTTSLLTLLVIIGLLASCSLSKPEAEPTEPPVILPSNTPPPPPTDTPEPTPTTDPYSLVVHTDMPNKPILSYWATDCSTGRYSHTADSPTIGSGCNVWEQNLIERPVNAELSLYYPHLDIVRFQMGKDETWLYADISTFATEESTVSMTGTYGLELDFDTNGAGDVLVFVDNPSQYPAGEWHVIGVQVWEDADKDIGGETLVYADPENPGNGYETLVFDQGLGDDPDLVWARISPEEPNTVEFAMKRSIIPPGVGAFAWWAWASQEPLDPAAFDYVDSFAEDEVYQIGNSCRWIFDGPPQPIPNVCAYEPPEEDKPDKPVRYCWVQEECFNRLCPAVCRVCPSPCPAGFTCSGSCGP